MPADTVAFVRELVRPANVSVNIGSAEDMANARKSLRRMEALLKYLDAAEAFHKGG
jgi:hypothetical protein